MEVMVTRIAYEAHACFLCYVNYQVGMTRVGSRSNNAELPVPMLINKSPETSSPTSGRAGLTVLVPILTPIFGVITVVIAVVLAANMVRLRKVVKEEKRNSFRYCILEHSLQ